MLKNRRFALLLCLINLPAIFAGCGKAPPEIAPVEGIVRINGKPQPRLLVRFMADPDKGNKLPIIASGTTDQQGKYKLHWTSKDQEGDGAPVGWHRVMLEDAALSQLPQGQPMPPQLIPPAYNSPASTPLSKEVKSGPQTIDLDVKK